MKKSATLKKRHAVDNLIDLAFLAPQLIIYITLTIIPFFIAIPIMFTDQVSFIDNDIDFIGIQNFLSVFKPPVVSEYLPAVARTAMFTITNYGMTYLFGMTMALLMYELSNRTKRGFFTVIYMPYMASGLGVGMFLVMLFGQNSGSLNLLFLKLGIIERAIDVTDPDVFTWSLPLLVGWRYAGFNMALFLSGLLTIPTDTIEASIIDGANYFQRLRRIYFPQMVPAIMVATTMTLIGSFGVFDELVGMGALNGQRSLQFLSIIVYNYGFGGMATATGSMAIGITMSMIVYVPLLFLAFGLMKLQKKLEY